MLEREREREREKERERERDAILSTSITKSKISSPLIKLTYN